MTEKAKAKKFIHDAADALRETMFRIHEMPESELMALIAACKKLTTANCWWLEYSLGPLLEREATTGLTVAAMGQAGGCRGAEGDGGGEIPLANAASEAIVHHSPTA